jgi:hypothetical protein
MTTNSTRGLTLRVKPEFLRALDHEVLARRLRSHHAVAVSRSAVVVDLVSQALGLNAPTNTRAEKRT